MLNLSQTDCRNGGIAFAAGEDLSLKAGYLVKLNVGKDLVLPTSDQDLTPYVITQGADQGYLCGAVPLSSFMNVRVMLDGTCEAGTMLVTKGDGRVTAYTAGTEARVIGVAEEKGVEGQHVLMRPVSVGLRGAVGPGGAVGTPGAQGAAGRDAGVLVIPKEILATGAGALPNLPSHVGYLVWLVYSVDSYGWYVSHGNNSRDEAQYVIIAEDANTVTLFPMGGASGSTNVAHTMGLPMTLSRSVVVIGGSSIVPGTLLGAAPSDGGISEYKVLRAAASPNDFIGQGTCYLTVVGQSGDVLVVQYGGEIPGGT